MESLFGPPDDQLRLIKCENCGILTRETNGKVGVTHKLNCEMLRKSGVGFGKKLGILSGLDSNSKKRASSEVSFDSSHLPNKKKKTTIFDHTIPELSSDSQSINNGKGSGSVRPMTKKQLKKTLAAVERLEKEKERKEKKRREEEAKKSRKLARAKGGPVDVNEQCGVLIPPNDTPCARSLTCKTHSMGAKRSVQGRSAPYDVLLNEWQKKHNPNWGDRKVVTPRVGPGIEPPQSKKKKAAAAAAAANSTSSTNLNLNKENPNSSNKQSKNNYSNNSRSNQSTSNSIRNSKNLRVTSSSVLNNPKSTSKSSTNGQNQTSQNRRKDLNQHSRTINDRVNEAKLLGETDQDFYLLIEPRQRKIRGTRVAIKEIGHDPLSGATEIRPDPDRRDTTNGDEIRVDDERIVLQQEVQQEDGDEDDDDDDESPSDREVEMIISALAYSGSGKPLGNPRMGSAWLHHRWSRFGRLGLKDSLRESFKK
ncbi:SAGA-associated factor 73 [Phakopsora pachyrhizi]|nr:SAGA-associated factor 73 [Phakopsora pachyrhizi]